MGPSRVAPRRLATRWLLGLVVLLGIATAWFALAPVVGPPRADPVAAAPVGSPAVATSVPRAPDRSPVGSSASSVAAGSANTTGSTVSTLAPPRWISAEPAIAPTTIPFATAATADEFTRKALTTRLGALRSTYAMPGASAAILFPDGTIWRATSGFADVAAKRRLSADTQFAVASISKTFLAALILVLAEEGRFALDDPIALYLPEPGLDPRITVRQLLDHTSGLADYFYHPAIDKALMADRRRAWTTDDALGYVGDPYFDPGAGWAYSNTNYLVLGMLAERIGGAPLATQLHARFLGPLALAHTHYQGIDPPIGPLARAYRFTGPGRTLKPIPLSDGTAIVPFTSVVTAAGSAGSLASTPTDLVNWARALYGGTVLTPASLSAMVADASVTARYKPSIPYGLGVQEAMIDGRPSLGHSGRLLGSRTVVRWLPQERIAIAVLTNQSRYDPNVLVRELLRVVLGTPPLCTGCPPAN